MKSFSDKIFEAKFSNFNDLELAAFKDELDHLKENNEFLKQIVASRKGLRINMGDRWYKAHVVPKSDKIEYGNKYLLIFQNPFTNGEQLTCKYDDEIDNHEPCETDEEKVIYCIGIADKFNKLHLVNQWEKDCTVQYKEKGLYIKKERESFYSEPGWYLYRKGYASYYVHQDLHRSEVNDGWYVFSEKQNNTFVRLQDCVILNISLLPAQFEKIQKDIEAKAKIDAERAKQEEERLKKQEEAEKWWKEREDYQHLGCANGWTETPEIVKKAQEDQEASWYSATIGRCYTQYFCDKYKITYTVDSSD